jgi:hypothetical protein
MSYEPSGGFAAYPRYPGDTPPGGQEGRPTGRHNPFAIASLACGCCGILPAIGLLGAVLGVVFGAVAMSQIGRSGGAQRGRALAIAGIVVGACFLVLDLVLVAIGGFHGHLHLRHHFFGHF